MNKKNNNKKKEKEQAGTEVVPKNEKPKPAAVKQLQQDRPQDNMVIIGKKDARVYIRAVSTTLRRHGDCVVRFHRSRQNTANEIFDLFEDLGYEVAMVPIFEEHKSGMRKLIMASRKEGA